MDGHGLLTTACLPIHHLAVYEQWTVEGVEPSSAGCKPTVFPLDDTPSHRSSDLGGARTHIPLLKRQVLSRLSYKAVFECVGQDLHLHSLSGARFTGGEAHLLPSRHIQE